MTTLLTGTTSTTGYVLTPDTTGTLVIKTGSGAGTTALTIDSSQNATVIGFIETVFALTGITPSINPANGTIQTWTLSGASTPTAASFLAGQSITLMITAGANSVTWTSMPVTWVGGVAPTLFTTGITIIVLWKVGTTIYGTLIGNA